jgi:hypothetical protein
MRRDKNYVRGRERTRSNRKKVRYLSGEASKPTLYLGNFSKYSCIELEIVDKYYKGKKSKCGSAIASRVQVVKDKKNLLNQLRYIEKTQIYDV